MVTWLRIMAAWQQQVQVLHNQQWMDTSLLMGDRASAAGKFSDVSHESRLCSIHVPLSWIGNNTHSWGLCPIGFVCLFGDVRAGGEPRKQKDFCTTVKKKQKKQSHQHGRLQPSVSALLVPVLHIIKYHLMGAWCVLLYFMVCCFVLLTRGWGRLETRPPVARSR